MVYFIYIFDLIMLWCIMHGAMHHIPITFTHARSPGPRHLWAWDPRTGIWLDHVPGSDGHVRSAGTENYL